MFSSHTANLQPSMALTLPLRPLGTPPYTYSKQSRPAIQAVKCFCSEKPKSESQSLKRRCLRCNTFYIDEDNSSTSCSFHGHVTGEKGLFSLAPPHQGIDGEWTDGSGVIVYKWNEKSNRPNTGSANWKKRWSCCSEYDENAPPCRRGSHVSYDDGFTLY